MASKIVTLGGKGIGEGRPVFIVFEAGPTHNGLESAKKLVDVAAGAGADAVKFQLLDAERMVSSRDVVFSYERLVDRASGETETVSEPLLDILKRRELSRDEWRELIAYCRGKGLEFFSTATDEEEVDFLAGLGVKTVKICSGDVNYHRLIRYAAGKDWSIQLDTGSSSIGEVERAVDELEALGFEDIIINHCPSGYPARLDGINLRVVPTLRTMFKYPVAFSDHTPGRDMDIAAVALGASMIEKTITLDRTTRSPEHIMSLEPGEAAGFVRAIRELEMALGNTRRVVTAAERTKTQGARRSLFAARDLAPGEVLAAADVAYARPGDGIPADMDRLVIGRTVRKAVAKGAKLALFDFE